MIGDVTLGFTPVRGSTPVANTSQLVYMLMEMTPTRRMADIQMPLNLSLVLDHSGSMSGEPIRSLKEAVKLILDRMQPCDVVSVVLFDENARVLIPSQAVIDPEHLKAVMDGIPEGGGTRMSEGINLGLAEIQKNLSQDRVNRLLLFTDGQTWEDESRCHALAAQAGDLKVPIVALGLGWEWDERFLDAIARASHGVADKIDTPQQMAPVFSKALQSMQATVVTNVSLTLCLTAGTSLRQVWQVLPLIKELDHRTISEQTIQVYLGDLEKDRGQTILLELTLLPCQPGRYRVAQAEVMYDVPSVCLTSRRARADVMVSFTSGPGLLQQYNPQVVNIVERVTAFKLQTQALDQAVAGNVVGALQKLRAALTRFLEMGERELSETCYWALQSLEQQGQVDQAKAKTLRYETEKLTQNLVDGCRRPLNKEEEKMKCPVCAEESRSGARFCRNCGALLPSLPPMQPLPRATLPPDHLPQPSSTPGPLQSLRFVSRKTVILNP